MLVPLLDARERDRLHLAEHRAALTAKVRATTDYRRALRDCAWVREDSARAEPQPAGHPFVTVADPPDRRGGARRLYSFARAGRLPPIAHSGGAPEAVLEAGARAARATAEDYKVYTERLADDAAFATPIVASEALCLVGAVALYNLGVTLDPLLGIAVGLGCMFACEALVLWQEGIVSPGLASGMAWLAAFELRLEPTPPPTVIARAQARRERQFATLLRAHANRRVAERRLLAVAGPPPAILVPSGGPVPAARPPASPAGGSEGPPYGEPMPRAARIAADP